MQTIEMPEQIIPRSQETKYLSLNKTKEHIGNTQKNVQTKAELC